MRNFLIVVLAAILAVFGGSAVLNKAFRAARPSVVRTIRRHEVLQ